MLYANVSGYAVSQGNVATSAQARVSLTTDWYNTVHKTNYDVTRHVGYFYRMLLPCLRKSWENAFLTYTIILSGCDTKTFISTPKDSRLSAPELKRKHTLTHEVYTEFLELLR